MNRNICVKWQYLKVFKCANKCSISNRIISIKWYYLPTPPLGQDMTEFNRFEFRVFLLLD